MTIPPAVQRNAPTLLVGALVLLLAMVRSGSPTERDMYWSARAGLENLQGESLARPDAWSWAPVDALFYPNSPGWNLVLGLGYGAVGLWGIFLVSLALMLAYFGLAQMVARRLGATPLSGLLGAGVTALLASAFLSARATLSVQCSLLLALLLPVLWEPRARRVSPLTNALVALATGLALSVAGQSLHLSWVTMAFGVAVAWAAYWWVMPLDRARRVALVLGGGVGLVAGVPTTPYGLRTTLLRVRETQAICDGLIMEWMSPVMLGKVTWMLALAGALVLAGGGAWWLVRRVRDGQRDTTSALLAASLVLMVPSALAGIGALRFVGVSLLVGLPVAAAGATRLAGRLHERAHRSQEGRWYSRPVREYTTARPWLVVMSLVALVLTPLALWFGLGRHGVPPEAAAARQLPSGCRLFAPGGLSGTVTLIRPDVTVWMDGRADYYGRQRLIDAEAYRLGEYDAAVPPGATCVLLPVEQRGYEAVTERVEQDPQWQRVADVGGFRVWRHA